MNVRENYVAAMKGEVPEWLPHYGTDVLPWCPSAYQDPYGLLYGLYYEKLAKGEPVDEIRHTDGFGVTWMLDEYGPITAPGGYVMDDVCDWEEKFSFPNLDEVDWDKMIAEESAYNDPEKALQLIIISPFSQLINAMGFENALVGVAADPEEVVAFCEKMTDFLIRCTCETMSRVKYDSFQLFEDLANANTTLISPETYREIFKPFDKKIIDVVKEYQPDIPVEFHVCGHCEALLDDFVEIGATAWQPAQPMNDLKAIKEKYGTDLVLVGCWDNVGICSDPNQTEESIRASVRSCIDTYAAGAGYVFWEGGAVGNSPQMIERLGWANDEAANYGKNPDIFKK